MKIQNELGLDINASGVRSVMTKSGTPCYVKAKWASPLIATHKNIHIDCTRDYVPL